MTTPRTVTGPDLDAAWREVRQRLRSPANIEPRAPWRCEWCGHPRQDLCPLCGRERSTK